MWPDGLIVFEYLAICNNENLPKVCSTFCQIGKKPSKFLPKTSKILPKCLNFAQYGHTGYSQDDEVDVSKVGWTTIELT